MLLGLLIAFHLGHNALAIQEDHYVVIPDASEYFEWSGLMGHHLHEGHLKDVYRNLWFDSRRPPLAIIPAMLLQALAGKPDLRLARMSTLSWLALLMLATYLIARRIHSPDAGLLAAASLAAMPAVMGFSRLIWLDIPFVAMCALSIHQLLRTDCFTRVKQGILFGGVAGLGLLTKVALPMFVAPLAAVLLVQGLRRPGLRLRVLGTATLSAAVALASFALWAAPQLSTIMGHFQQAKTFHGWRGLLAGTVGHKPESLTFYLQYIWTGAIGPLGSALFLAGLLALIYRDRRRALTITSAWLWGSMLGLVFFLPWLRYFLPAIPAVAVVIGAGLLEYPFFARRRRWAVPLACALLTLFSVQQTWFGPELHACPFLDKQNTWNRVLCAGMVRPYREKVLRPDLSGLPLTARITGGVVPQHMAPSPAPLPFDCLAEALSQWTFVDLQLSASFDLLGEEQEITSQDLNHYHMLAVAQPHAPWKIPKKERSAHQQVTQFLRQNRTQWKKAGDFDFPSVARLQIFINTALEDRTSGAAAPVVRP